MIDCVMLALATMVSMSVVSVAYALGKVEHVQLVSRAHVLKAMRRFGVSLDGAMCVVCGRQITEENISAVVKYNGAEYFTCKELRCNTLADLYVKRS